MSGTAGGALGGKCAGGATHPSGGGILHRTLIVFSKFLTSRSVRLDANNKSNPMSCMTLPASQRQEMNVGAQRLRTQDHGGPPLSTGYRWLFSICPAMVKDSQIQ